jgi:hypothetical protein
MMASLLEDSFLRVHRSPRLVTGIFGGISSNLEACQRRGFELRNLERPAA